MTTWLASLVPFASALAGNYWLQNRLARRIRDADETKRRLYALLALVAEYWTAEQRDTAIEARVLATTLIVIAELRRMQDHSKRLVKWYSNTEERRLAMIDAATGGCFQQEDWTADPDRVRIVAREMGYILRELRRAC